MFISNASRGNMIGRRFRQRFSECSEVYLRAWRSSHLGVPRITCLAVLLEHLFSSTEFVLAYGLNRARVVFRVFYICQLGTSVKA